MTFPDANDREEIDRFRSALRGAKSWITSGRLELCSDLGVKVLKIPELNFRAFHPDLRAATNVKTKLLVAGHYNSQIAVWAYHSGLSITDTIKLFNRRVFGALGYMDCWLEGVADLRARFSNAGMESSEFERFFLRVKRIGQFMHTSNHPRVEALVELARVIARRLGGHPGRTESDISIPDALTYAQWPVYPEIGDELGLHGNYQWRFSSHDKVCEIDGLEAYIIFAHQCYADQGIRPADLASLPQMPKVDAILREQVHLL